MRSQICDHGEEFHPIREKVGSLEVFLKKFEKSNDSRKMTDLEAQIKEVADGVEITIQLRLTDIIMAKNEIQKKLKSRERLCDSLKQVAEEIDCVQKESTKIQYKANQSLEEYFVQASSSAKVILNGKNNMVGHRDERERMMTELTRDCTKWEEIPIEFAETSSLKLIEFKDCKPHLEASATRIQQEQEDIGNNPVDVRISSKAR
ncbi:hypothetical protein H5410_059299 [Solanum commersonii]|uniref:Uncharacterized protein n=1 Tax=Solanum commersonii TaxID=4109 RepID=A0A9J5W224_SOLCO|nr:hypothetical protein H5410_059299 [Solanum commersonii]